jgi:type VI secretion system secreted protein Hcp
MCGSTSPKGVTTATRHTASLAAASTLTGVRVMKFKIAAALAAVLLCGPALAARDVIALKLDGVQDKDGIDIRGLEGQIELLTISGGVTATISQSSQGGGSGKAQAQPYTIVKHVDSVSPTFLVAVATGKHYANATISFNRETAGGTFQYLTIELDEVQISSQNLSGSEAHAGRDTEVLTLVYREACLTYHPQLANGQMGTPIKNCFDFSRNQVE